jgi:hypothetical protein
MHQQDVLPVADGDPLADSELVYIADQIGGRVDWIQNPYPCCPEHDMPVPTVILELHFAHGQKLQVSLGTPESALDIAGCLAKQGGLAFGLMLGEGDDDLPEVA